jgi:sulfonate transport system substrate-binding protein
MRRNIAILLGLMLTLGTVYATAQPVVNIGHVGHDHQIALGVAALKGKAMQTQCGVWLKELKSRQVYELCDDSKVLAELHLHKVKGGSAMPAAMERGDLQIGCGGVAAVAFFVDKGNDFKIISALNTDGDMLVMRKDFGASSWADFVAKAKVREKPLVIGYKAPVAVAKLIFERGLIAEGIAFGGGDAKAGQAIKVRMVNLLGQKNMVPSLAAGVIDGFVTNEPAASKAEYKKVGRIVCDLADLPPKGKWRFHPCCCVAARSEIIKQHPEVLTALMKLMLVSTDIINADKKAAAKMASTWTKQQLEVEMSSVPNICYVCAPSKDWKEGMKTWISMMQEMGTFKKRFARKRPATVLDELCDFSFIEKAQAELKPKK